MSFKDILDRNHLVPLPIECIFCNNTIILPLVSLLLFFVTANINLITFLRLLTGHEAFSSLVDVAVQQPLLPVPHKDEKRQTVNVSTPAEHAAHHDIRYHQQIAREQMAMQIHQQQQMRQHQQQQQNQQQQQQQQAQQQQQQHQMDLQRRQQSATAYREQLERERREEQYRLQERQERDRHAQVERERAERHHHQERLERDRNLQIERDRIDRERIDRAREQIVQSQNLMEEQERERREASRLLVSVGGPGFLRDPPSRGLPDRDRERER